MVTDKVIYVVVVSPQWLTGPFDTVAAAKAWAERYNKTNPPEPARPIALQSPEGLLQSVRRQQREREARLVANAEMG
jgi:hypothetical protein